MILNIWEIYKNIFLKHQRALKKKKKEDKITAPGLGEMVEPLGDELAFKIAFPFGMFANSRRDDV